MTNFSPLIGHLNKRVQFSSEEAVHFTSSFKPVTIKAGDFIIKPGFVTKQRNFILKGLFRSYIIDDKMKQHTIQLAMENEWIQECASYITQTPSNIYIEAMEDSEVLQLDYMDEQKLLAESPRFETFFRVLAECLVADLKNAIIFSYAKTGEERFIEFEHKHPGIDKRVPGNILSDFIGIPAKKLLKLQHSRAGNH